MTDAPNTTPAADTSLWDRVAKVIELIRPTVKADGGDLELVEVTKAGMVRIRLHGACIGCPSAAMTLRYGVEQNLRKYVPDVTGVEAVED